MFSAKIREKSIGKIRSMRLLAFFLVPVVVLTMGNAVSEVWAWGVVELEVAELYFELNDTDDDLGIHGMIDGGPWKQIWIKDSDHRLMMNVIAKGRLGRQAVTELFFESAEPTFDELDPDDFFDRFKEGYYKIFGWSEEGKLLKGKSLIRHVMPAAPSGIEVSGVPINHKDIDCDSEELPTVTLADNQDLIISWEAVDSNHSQIGGEGEIVPALYQVVVEVDLDLDGEEFTSVFSVDLPPTETEMTVPAGFIALGLDEEGEGEFKFEILVKEELGGNQTAAESCFVVVVVPAKE